MRYFAQGIEWPCCNMVIFKSINNVLVNNNYLIIYFTIIYLLYKFPTQLSILSEAKNLFNSISFWSTMKLV